MKLRSPAKINLTLRIKGKDRKDGYHFIDSVFDTIGLHDLVVIKKTPSGIILRDKLKKLGIPPEKNIMYRAAAAMLETGRVKGGVAIDFYKRIPDGAGLGGGSSNAAAVIKGIVKLYGLKISDRRLENIAARLGSDVPFFLQGGKAVVSGKGERIKPVKSRKKLWYVLVFPAVKVNTKYAYKLIDTRNRLTKGKSYTKLIIDYLTGKTSVPKGTFCNDFQDVVMSEFPAIRAAKSMLEKAGAQDVAMSGSGSTVFAVFENKAEAKDVYNKVRNSRRNWFICLTHSA